MLSRNQLFGLILCTFICGYMVNLYISIPILWILLILPAMGMILVFPSWFSTAFVGIFFLVTMFLTECILHQWQLPYDYGFSLLLVGVVGNIVLVAMTFALLNMTQQIKAYKTLALTDPLTNIYNRRYLDQYMRKIKSSYPTDDFPLTLMMFDIDHFKKVNDAHGHHAGDMILKNIVHVVKSMIKETDTFVRLSGEEFIIVMPHCSLEEGTDLAHDIRKTIRCTPFIYKDTPIPITISIGVTSYHNPSHNNLLENVDKALYRAKKSGRDQVINY